MTRTWRGGAGPVLAEDQAYIDTLPTGFSVVSTPAASQGTFRWKATGTTTGSLLLSPQGSTAMSATYRWVSVRDWRLDGTLNAGQLVEFLKFAGSDNHILRWDRQSNSTYKIRLSRLFTGSYTDAGTSSSTFDTGTDYDIRYESDGTTAKLWVNGTLEIEASWSYALASGGIRLQNNTLAAGQDMYWGAYGAWDSAAEADRPGTALVKYYGGTDGDGTSAVYRKKGGAVGTGTYTEWDDWDSGAANDDTDYNIANSGDVGEEVSTTSNVTVSDPANGVVLVSARGRAAAASKTVDTYTRIEDASANSDEVQNANLGGTSYTLRRSLFPLAAGGGAWSQTEFDNLRIGMRSVSGNGTGDVWTAIMAEILSVDDDPPIVVPRMIHDYRRRRV